MGTLVQQLHAVLLSGEGGGEVHGDHLQHGIASRQPLPVVGGGGDGER